MKIKNNARYWTGLAIFSAYWPAKASNVPLLVENGANSIEAAGAYILLSSIIGKPKAAITTLTAMGGAEIAQNFGVWPFPGTYDPKDFLAFGLGVGVAVGLEKMISHFSSS